jgi:hypothetical protein
VTRRLHQLDLEDGLATHPNFKQHQTRFHDLAACFRARFDLNSRPLQTEGAGNAGRPMRPIAACAMVVVERTRVSQVTPESPGIPHAMVYGLLRALPGAPGFLATVAREKLASHELDTSVGVSGPHAFSVRLKRPRLKAPSASTASRPALLTLRNAPLVGRDGKRYRIIRIFGKAEYFHERGLTIGQIIDLCGFQAELSRS